MTLKIEITVPQEQVEAGSAPTYLQNTLSAIGYYPLGKDEKIEIIVSREPPAAVETTEAAEPEAAPAPEPEPTAAPATKKPGRPRKAAPEPAAEKPMNISTGEERIDPTNPDDKAQDAADEAEEHASAPMTEDDLKAAMTAYFKAYGMEAIVEDRPKLMARLGNTAEGKPITGLTDMPKDAATIGRAVALFRDAIEANPFKRERQS